MDMFMHYGGVAAATRPGKYPIHFHLVGNTTNAYVKNNAVYK